jgi:hypothetical protein
MENSNDINNTTIEPEIKQKNHNLKKTALKVIIIKLN